MADTEHIAIVELGVGDAPAGLVLSTEAHWNQNEADWRFFLSKGIVFGVRDGAQLVATAALLPYSSRQRLDQHGAGDGELAPPRHCDTAGRCLPQRGDQARAHHLARCDAGTALPSTARLASRRRCNCGGCGWNVRGRPKRRHRCRPATSTNSSRAIRAPWASTASLLLTEFAGRAGSRIVSDRQRHGPGPRRTHRPPDRSAVRG